MLIAIEGVDGAGKRTLTGGLRAAFEARRQVRRHLAFPALRAVGDRRPRRRGAARPARRPVVARCTRWPCCSRWTAPARATRSSDSCGGRTTCVILDRYVASNAAYSAARLHQDADGEVVAWVRELEYGRLRPARPDWQVLLDVPAELAAQRAGRRANTEADRAPRRLRTRRRTAAPHRRGVRRTGRRAVGRPVDRRAGCGSGRLARALLPRRLDAAVNGATRAGVVAEVYRDSVTPWTP